MYIDLRCEFTGLYQTSSWGHRSSGWSTNPQTKPAPGTRTRRWAITSEEETQPAKTVRAGNVVPSRVYNIEPESRAAGFVYFCGAKLGPRLESWISGGMGCTAFRSRIRAGMRYRFLTYLSN